MVIEIALIILGLSILLIAGDLLVRGAVSLAAALKIPALIVSLTIVAFGTSAPELVVTIQAILNDASGIAIGNIIGSNIANVLLVLGMPAIIYPMSTHIPGLRRHGVVMLAGSAIFAAFAYTRGMLDFQAGAILFTGIVCYITYMMVRALSGASSDPVLDEVEDYAEGNGISLTMLVYLAAGLIGLPLGAHLLVTNGSTLAAELGVRDTLIGLTIVAFGTSLPELATVAVAAFRKKSDVAIGNVIGSNIFNLLAVGGAAGLAGGAAFDAKALSLDLPAMLAVTGILSFYVFLKRDIGRPAGIVFFLTYIFFIFAVSTQTSA